MTGQHARITDRPGSGVKVEKPLTVDVRVRVDPVLVGGLQHAHDDLVVTELAAVMLGKQGYSTGYYRRSQGGAGRAGVTVSGPGWAVGVGNGAGNIYTRRCQAEFPGDAAAVGETRDLTVSVRCDHGKRVAAQLGDADGEPGYDLDRSCRLNGSVKVYFAAGVACRPHVDGAFGGRGICLGNCLKGVGESAADSRFTVILNTPGKTKAQVDCGNIGVQPVGYSGKFLVKRRQGTGLDQVNGIIVIGGLAEGGYPPRTSWRRRRSREWLTRFRCLPLGLLVGSPP